MPVPPGSPPHKPQPTSGLFHFANNQETRPPLKPTGRHAVALGPPRPFAPFVQPSGKVRRYYFVLGGEVLRHGCHRQFVGECLYVLVKAGNLAHSAAEWYRTAKLVAETRIKVDLGIPGQISGAVSELIKGATDIHVAKADLFTVKPDLARTNTAEAWGPDHRRKDSFAKLFHELSVSAQIPSIPKTPWEKLARGGMYEHVQLVDGNQMNDDRKTDWGLYTIVSIAQAKTAQTAKGPTEGNPFVATRNSPGIGKSTPSETRFDYGSGSSVSAALLVGADIPRYGA